MINKFILLKGYLYNMKEKNKKWKIKFSEEALAKIDELPDKAYKELTCLIKGFKTGRLDPKKIGKPVDWIKLKIKLICPKCKSKKVEWLLDKNSKEVTFHCLNCNESFWMTKKEYENAIKKNTDCII